VADTKSLAGVRVMVIDDSNKSGKHKATPVIMLSSKDSLFDRARGRMVGSDEYLTKPFTKESLLKAVEAHLAQRSIA
jgi:twitching motility two-component system response regulator PilG